MLVPIHLRPKQETDETFVKETLWENAHVELVTNRHNLALAQAQEKMNADITYALASYEEFKAWKHWEQVQAPCVDASTNGAVPAECLTPVAEAPGHMLTFPVAEAADRAIRDARAAGQCLGITDSYRPYGVQVSLKARKGGLAAAPGSSEHGWGKAIDWYFCSPGAEAWLHAHISDYGMSFLQGEPWHSSTTGR